VGGIDLLSIFRHKNSSDVFALAGSSSSSSNGPHIENFVKAGECFFWAFLACSLCFAMAACCCR